MAVTKEFEFAVEKLALKPGDVLVVKSWWDIDVKVVQKLREKFNCQVLGLGPDDEVSTLRVSPEDTIIVKGENMTTLPVEVQADVEKVLKEKLGCKSVLFVGLDVTVEKRG